MAFCELKYFSKTLEKAIAANLILPEKDVPGPFAVLYLLHGLSDDHTAWQRKTSIERYVEGLPLIVVMPDTERGFYTDIPEGLPWESALIRDLIPYIDTLFPTRAERGGRGLAGLSMGGYGAIKLALKYPDIFCAGVSHSGSLTFAHSHLLDQPEHRLYAEFVRIHGPNPAGGPNDLFALSERLKPEQRPALRFDCGIEDGLLESNRAFHRHLQTLKFAHEYQEYPGAHDWKYWDAHVTEAIAFHVHHLGLISEPKIRGEVAETSETSPRD